MVTSFIVHVCKSDHLSCPLYRQCFLYKTPHTEQTSERLNQPEFIIVHIPREGALGHRIVTSRSDGSELFGGTSSEFSRNLQNILQSHEAPDTINRATSSAFEENMTMCSQDQMVSFNS